MSFNRIVLFCLLIANGILLAAVMIMAPFYLMVRPIVPAGDGRSDGDFRVLGATDPIAIRNRLRLAGFPAEAQRAVLHALFTERDRPNREAIVGSAEAVPYWRKSAARGVRDPRVRDALSDLDRKEAAAVSLLVPDPEGDDPLVLASLRQDYGNLPAAALKKISALVDHYNEAVSEIAVNNIIAAKDQGKVEDIWRQEDAALREALTADEYEIYLMHTSGTAWSLREKLWAFNPTEREFQELFELQYAFDRQFEPLAAHGRGSEPPSSELRVASAQQALEAAIRFVLGPKRYGDYVTRTDPSYLRGKSVVDEPSLPGASTQEGGQIRGE